MKQYSNIILFFVSLLSFCLGSIVPEILTKGSTTEFSPDDKTIIFDVTAFNNEEIKLEVRATSCADNEIVCQFLDSTSTSDGNGEGSDLIYLEPFKTKNKNGSIYNYYSIVKNETYLSGLSGKYLSISFNYNSDVHIKLTDEQKDQKNTTKFTKTNSYYLQKYGTKTVDSSEGGIIMETSGFKNGSQIYLKITATEFIESKIYYEFVDNINNYNPKNYYEDYYYVSPSKTDTNNNAETKYYTIKKDSSHLDNRKGNYLVIYFECIGEVTVSNTKKDGGELSSGAKAVIVVLWLL